MEVLIPTDSVRGGRLSVFREPDEKVVLIVGDSVGGNRIVVGWSCGEKVEMIVEDSVRGGMTVVCGDCDEVGVLTVCVSIRDGLVVIADEPMTELKGVLKLEVVIIKEALEEVDGVAKILGEVTGADGEMIKMVEGILVTLKGVVEIVEIFEVITAVVMEIGDVVGDVTKTVVLRIEGVFETFEELLSIT